MKKIKLKITLQKVLRYLYLFTIIVIIITIYLMSDFLYRNFYLIITQSQEIIDLQSQIADETVNMKKYEIIIKENKEKNEMPAVSNINNPFD